MSRILAISLAVFILVLLAVLVRDYDSKEVSSVGPGSMQIPEGANGDLAVQVSIDSNRVPAPIGTKVTPLWQVNVVTLEGANVAPKDLSGIILDGKDFSIFSDSQLLDDHAVEIPWQPTGCQLSARLSGYGTGTIQLDPSSLKAELLLYPESMGTVSGAATWSMDGGPAKDALIICWKEGPIPQNGGAEQVAQGKWVNEIRWTKTDSKGWYAIRGLERDAKYVVTGTTPGGIVSRRHRHVSAIDGNGALQLEFDRFLARVLQLEPSGKSEVQLNPALWGGPTYADALDEDFKSVSLSGREIEILALGVKPKRLSRSPYIGHLLLQSATSSAIKALGMITVNAPGFTTTASEFFAVPITQEIAVTTVELKDEASGRGELRFRFESISKTLGEYLDSTRTIGILIGTSGTTSWGYKISGTEVLNGGTVTGIPFGEYQLQLRPSDWTDPTFSTFRGGSTVLIHTPKENRDLIVDLGQLGALEVLVFEESSEVEYSGALSLLLRSKQTAHGSLAQYVSFDKAPYLIPLLPAGEYRVLPENASGLVFKEADSVLLLVESNRRATAVLVGGSAK